MDPLPAVSATLAAALLSGTGPAAAQPVRAAEGVLVGANGLTLYVFDRDPPNGGESTCSGGCAAVWPPLMAADTDQPSGPWTIVVRGDGSRQWAYKGRPLYFFQQGTKAGDRSGDGIGGVWHAARE